MKEKKEGFKAANLSQINSASLAKKSGENLVKMIQPGIYMIKCISNGRVYIGESQNILERLGKHSAILEQGLADCNALQADWNKYQKDDFEFRVVDLGRARYGTAADRKREESKILKQLSDEGVSLYNCLSQRTDKRNMRQPVLINGIKYYSISQAMTELNIPNTTLRRRLKSPNLPQYILLEPQEVGYSIVSINGVVYHGLVDVVAAGLAKNTLELMRKLNSKAECWKDWFYIEKASDVRKIVPRPENQKHE